MNVLNKNILNTEIQHFINANLKSDIAKLVLKGSPFNGISIQEIVEQLVSKTKCEKKLPTWFLTEGIYFPNKLNIEQTSSEITAKYKASLISGTSLIDVTGGFGVDAYYFSKKIKEVIHCEINQELSQIVAHNLKQLKCKNIETYVGDGIEFTTNSDKTYDWIYIDPSRRNDIKGKVFLLNDCLPNVPENLEKLFAKTNNILLKISPILDIKSAINELTFVKEIHVVSLENEVKELLFILEKNYCGNIHLKTINFLKSKKQCFNFELNSEEDIPSYSAPKKYLFEPNPAILKAGAFKQIATKLNIDKLHQHSHLYTSNKLINFPGRSFLIEQITAYDKKILKKICPSKKANITTRNFPETVAQIRKKTGLKDGGNKYLFFTTNLENNHIVLVCSKI